MSNLLVKTVRADGTAPCGAVASATTVLTKIGSHTGPGQNMEGLHSVAPFTNMV